MAVYMALYVLESFWSFTWGSVNLDRKRQDEAEAKDKKIEELTRSRVPELRGEVMQGIIDYASNSPLGTVKLDESQVLLRCHIANFAESQTTVHDHRAKIESGERVFYGEPLAIGSGLHLRPQDEWSNDLGERIAEFDNEIASTPIARGVRKDGWLRFRVGGLPPTEFDAAVVSVTLRDAFGGTHELKSRGTLHFELRHLMVWPH